MNYFEISHCVNMFKWFYHNLLFLLLKIIMVQYDMSAWEADNWAIWHCSMRGWHWCTMTCQHERQTIGQYDIAAWVADNGAIWHGSMRGWHWCTMAWQHKRQTMVQWHGSMRGRQLCNITWQHERQTMVQYHMAAWEADKPTELSLLNHHNLLLLKMFEVKKKWAKMLLFFLFDKIYFP